MTLKVTVPVTVEVMVKITLKVTFKVTLNVMGMEIDITVTAGLTVVFSITI